MRTITRETFYCDHCNKMYLSKGHCKIHEMRCSKNPENNRDCFSCKGLIIDHPTITEHDREGNKVKHQNIKVYYCSSMDIYVTPPKAEHKGYKYILDKENIFMPKACSAKERKTANDIFNDLLNNSSDIQ